MAQNFRSRALASVAAVAIVASGAVGAALYEGQPALAQAAKAPIAVNAQAPATFADVVDKVKPAVVSVRVKVENALADERRLCRRSSRTCRRSCASSSALRRERHARQGRAASARRSGRASAPASSSPPTATS